ncbi:MAG: rhodanese-like domain-containing protein, partial [Gammaproteobacteria bacterium]
AIVIVSKGQNNDHLTMATRLYWQLKYFGHDNMGILNGGVAAWLADGRQVASGASKPLPGDWQAGAGRNAILASTADVAAAVKSGDAQLVDTRSLSQYLGTAKKPYVHAMGHIPGAKVYPYELMNTAGESARFLPAEKLGQLMVAMDIDEDAATITYCNSGHLASGGWFIMSELLGNKNVRLYDGSMHEWTLMKQPVKAMQME